ncbi:MAG: hypothetical protein IJ530_00960 [Treponema sp.]|uniref:hypothetical protein n=1 Tax=Treponema sp. TaxID=166 RepID=UPI0025FD426B|nr:hypothetical protein [Treponema sp.]MBQ8678314.1 hypothetical protein [Treponema sp.]
MSELEKYLAKPHTLEMFERFDNLDMDTEEFSDFVQETFNAGHDTGYEIARKHFTNIIDGTGDHLKRKIDSIIEKADFFDTPSEAFDYLVNALHGLEEETDL